jgi:hypothetical protein
VRRGAFKVEDHPIEYLDVEGVIPAGGYGGGDVVVWDIGTWEPADGRADPRAALDAGELHLDLAGQKPRGRFVLVRSDDDRGRERWLLLHKRDEHAQEGWDPEDHPASVWAANLGALEWHAWTSRVDHPRRPTYALVDLDPGGRTTWEDVLVLARLHRTAFEHLGVAARPKVTGRRGLQIRMAIRPGPGSLRPDAFTIRTVLERLDRCGDLFDDVLTQQQDLPRLS